MLLFSLTNRKQCYLFLLFRNEQKLQIRMCIQWRTQNGQTKAKQSMRGSGLWGVYFRTLQGPQDTPSQAPVKPLSLQDPLLRFVLCVCNIQQCNRIINTTTLAEGTDCYKFKWSRNDWRAATSHFIFNVTGKKNRRRRWDAGPPHRTRTQQEAFRVLVQRYVQYVLIVLDNCSSKLFMMLPGWKIGFGKTTSWVYKHKLRPNTQ